MTTQDPFAEAIVAANPPQVWVEGPLGGTPFLCPASIASVQGWNNHETEKSAWKGMLKRAEALVEYCRKGAES